MEKLNNDYIQHHGINGQKWGVRNGPPYPLSRSVSTGKSLKKGKSGSGSNKKYGSLDKKKAKEQKRREKERIKAVRKERNEANKRRSILSDQDLDRRLNRLRKERELNNLTTTENEGRIKRFLRKYLNPAEDLSTVKKSFINRASNRLYDKTVKNMIGGNNKKNKENNFGGLFLTDLEKKKINEKRLEKALNKDDVFKKLKTNLDKKIEDGVKEYDNIWNKVSKSPKHRNDEEMYDIREETSYKYSKSKTYSDYKKALKDLETYITKKYSKKKSKAFLKTVNDDSIKRAHNRRIL